MIRDPGPGEDFLYIYRLTPGSGPEYDRRHQEVWPEVLALLDEAGLYDYRIWRHEEIVVSRMRARAGFRRAAAVTAANAVQARWTASMSGLFASIATADGEPLWLTAVFAHRVLPDSKAQ